MDRYSFLLILNLPFVIFGFFKAYTMYKATTLNWGSLGLRIIFWLGILLSLVFARNIYQFLYREHLVNGQELSVTTIVLATGLIFSFFLSLRLYSKLDALEKRLAELLTKLAIITSEDKRPKKQ